MNLNLKNKNAIVCASSQGLGKAAALDLAEEGVNLAICSRDQDKINNQISKKNKSVINLSGKTNLRQAMATLSL